VACVPAQRLILHSELAGQSLTAHRLANIQALCLICRKAESRENQQCEESFGEGNE
jgi:hypothetical protein